MGGPSPGGARPSPGQLLSPCGGGWRGSRSEAASDHGTLPVRGTPSPTLPVGRGEGGSNLAGRRGGAWLGDGVHDAAGDQGCRWGQGGGGAAPRDRAQV